MEIAIGVPAELIRRRPDIRQAERELAAQTARIGVAEAALYPQFSLSGFFGFESGSAGNLFDAASQTYTFGPAFVWNLFDFGRVRNNIKVQGALQEQALARYEQTVLTAVSDVESALAAYAREQERKVSLGEAVEAAERTVEIAESQYAEGLRSFQNVLDSQRSLFAQGDARASSMSAITSSLISLYRALESDWNPAELSGQAGFLIDVRLSRD
jgi:outer membrane protein TolC